MSDEVISYYDDGKPIYQKEWFLNGKLHREDVPAVISYYRSGDIEYEVWYLNGKQFWPEDWLAKNGYKWPLTKDQQTEFLLVFG